MLSLAELGQSSDVTNGLPTATKHALLLYEVKSRSWQSLNRLRYNYACKSDKSASLFPPTDGTFQQYTRCVKYQLGGFMDPQSWSKARSLESWWQWMAAKEQQTRVCHVRKRCGPKEVRDLTHLYCIDEDCSWARTCQCLNAKLTCTELCSCNCDEWSNRDHSLLLNDSSDDENDWLMTS